MLCLEELVVISFGILLRCMVSIHPHSGQGNPPMYGDYEAQRHWQEITVNLPLKEWYFNSTDNDLLYWGLDYPPLTAYHSWLLGQVAKTIDPSYVELHESRGKEAYNHRVFMRNTVLVADLLILIPAILAFVRACHPGGKTAQVFGIAAFLLYPGLIIIDNGHFQYNNVSLGLFTLAVACILNDRNLFASSAFVMALSYKQMELYHALPFFFYLLGLVFKRRSIFSLIKIAFAVLATFGLIWWPFLQNLDLAKQVLVRIFPLDRGLFEDKVANFWCSLNVALKLKDKYDQDTLALGSLAVTVLTVLPSNILLLARPSKANFLGTLLTTSLAFFLFSYQVHEKSILLAAFPALMNLVGLNLEPLYQKERYGKLMLIWFAYMSTYSMLPLLIRDKLELAFICLQTIYITSAHFGGYFDFQDDLLANVKHVAGTGSSGKKAGSATKKTSSPKPLTESEMTFKSMIDWVVWTAFNFSVVGSIVLALCLNFVTPPANYPHLWPLMISVFSAVHFMGFLVYFNVALFRSQPQLVEEVSVEKKRK